jgi:hypothetical protein
MTEPALSGLRLRIAQYSLLALVVAFVVSCSDSPVSTSSPETRGPLFAMADGGHFEGNPDVFFLEPLTDFDATNPNFDGMPNPNLMPTAKICRLGVGDGGDAGNANQGGPGTVFPCVEDIDTLPMTYDVSGGFYKANLKDAGYLDADYHHRIEILVAGLALGAFRDLDVDDGPATASCTDEDFCRVNRDGQGRVGLPIKVIIEVNAACYALDPGFDPNEDFCATATLNAGQALVAQQDGEPIAAATPNGGATLSIRSCQDLRERGTGIDHHGLGRIDLVTWGDCVEIDALDLETVSGVAELCDAPVSAAAGGLDPDQVERLTIHRFTFGDEFAYAMAHGEASNCDAPAPAQGQAYQFSKTQQFARAVRRTWRTISDQVSELLQPATLNACNRGCAGSGTFRSSYQVADPAAWTYDASNSDGDLGAHEPGTVVTATAKVFDSGEFDDGSMSSPDAYVGLRVTVTHTHPDGSTQTDSVFSDANGEVAFSFAVEGGINTVTFEAIGVGRMDDLDPANGVFAPSMTDADTVTVLLGIDTLTFTAIGIVPFYFDPDPPTGEFKMSDFGDENLAEFDDLKVCGSPGAVIESLEAVRNNGAPTEFGIILEEGQDPVPVRSILPVSIDTAPDEDGNFCYPFSGLTLDKTGAYRIVVNGADESKKFNIKP